MTPARMSEAEYRALAELRYQMRRVVRVAEAAARDVGLTPAQHQLLLVVRGWPDPSGPTLTEVAERLQQQLHSVSGLADRAEVAGLVRRRADPHDGRRHHLVLTRRGRAQLDALYRTHRDELGRARRDLLRALTAAT